MIDLLPDETVLYQWVLFMVALFTLHFGVFRPVLGIISERKQRTVEAKKKADVLSRKSEETVSFCEKKMEEARGSGLQKKTDQLQQAEKFRDDLMRKTRGEIDQKLEGLRHEIDHEMKEVSMQLRQYAQGLSREIASKIIGREIA